MATNTQTLLILDLDETLIHASNEPLEWGADFVAGPYHVYKRPGLNAFLKVVYQHFEVAVWSSSSADYVSVVVSHVFSTELSPKFAWSRERCVQKYDPERQTYHWVKDLRKVKRIGYDLNRVLIVDDEAVKLQRNYGNAIYVRPFEGDQCDCELEILSGYLASIAHMPNVRELEKRGWRTATRPSEEE